MRGQPFLFNIASAPAPLHGSPKSLRQERLDLGQPNGDRRLEQLITFAPDSKPVESSFYRTDGSLSYRTIYEYADDGLLTIVKTFDGDGKLCQTSRQSRPDSATQVEIVTNRNGKEISRSITKSDRAGHVIESTLDDLEGGSRLHQTNRYDAQGNFVEGETISSGMSGEFPSRIVGAAQANGRLRIIAYSADGNILIDSKILPGDEMWEASNVFAECSQTLTVAEQIEAKDDHGNWTKKTVFSGGQPVAELFRSISYYASSPS